MQYRLYILKGVGYSNGTETTPGLCEPKEYHGGRVGVCKGCVSSCERGRGSSWEKILVSETIELCSIDYIFLKGWVIQMVQRLTLVSVSLKNIMEEEWGFAKALCPHVRGGEAQVVGKDFGK